MQKFGEAHDSQYLNLKKFFDGQSLTSDKDKKDTIAGLAATFFDEGIQKLVPRYEKYLNSHGAEIASPVQRLATGSTVRGLDPGGDEIFSTRPDQLPIQWVLGLFPGGTEAGARR
jgi:hypothetical protein